MQTKFIVLLTLTFAVGMLATIVFIKPTTQRVMKPTVVHIYVAKENIEGGAKLTPTQFTLEPWPLTRLPAGAILEVEQFDQKYIKQNLYVGEPVLETKITGARSGALGGCLGPLSNAEMERVIEELKREHHATSAYASQYSQ